MPLTELDASDNDVEAEGLRMLVDALTRKGMQQGCPLRVMDLSGNTLCGVDEYGDGSYSSVGIMRAVRMLVAHHPKGRGIPVGTTTLLAKLDISRNSISVQDGRRLMRAAEAGARPMPLQLQLSPRLPGNLAIPDP